MLQRGHSGDECDLALTLCKYTLRKGESFFSELGTGATSESGNYICKCIAANVWWSFAQYFVIASCG